jgi:hypothetical protein
MGVTKPGPSPTGKRSTEQTQRRPTRVRAAAYRVSGSRGTQRAASPREAAYDGKGGKEPELLWNQRRVQTAGKAVRPACQERTDLDAPSRRTYVFDGPCATGFVRTAIFLILDLHFYRPRHISYFLLSRIINNPLDQGELSRCTTIAFYLPLVPAFRLHRSFTHMITLP